MTQATLEPSRHECSIQLDVTTDPTLQLIEPLLLELQEEKCAHTWQPALSAVSKESVMGTYGKILKSDRPGTVYLYYTVENGMQDSVAVAMLSPRISANSLEDGIPVLGRTFVRSKYRGQSIYSAVLIHRLDLCLELWKQRLYGVHIGTSSRRVEDVFRVSFPGQTIKLGMEDLGDAGWVIALLGITDLFKKEILQPLNGCLLYTSPSPRDATLSRMPSSA